jgi:hypothetical protein
MISLKFGRKVLKFEYHWAAYHVFASASRALTVLHLINPTVDAIADYQRQAAMKAHTHRIRGEKVFA